jgi:hypothetical protein
MTERDWLGPVDFDLLIDACLWLADQKKNRRNLRLWGCACCRRLGDLLPDRRSLAALEVAERLADGLAKRDEVRKARDAAKLVPQPQRGRGTPAEFAARSAVLTLHPGIIDCSQTAAVGAAIALSESGAKSREDEEQAQFELLRDVFNPFRKVKFDKEWRTDTTVALAKQMYESRDFGAMPILADALQDAGCEEVAVLSHCRDAKQVHVRGCWAVDLVLGKK